MFNPEIPASRRDGISGNTPCRKTLSGHFWRGQWQVALLLGRPNLTEPTSSGPLAPGPPSLVSQFFAAELAIVKCGIQRGLQLDRSHAGCGDER